jgi:ClpP class serine protease
MDFSSLIWIVLILMAFQPVFAARWLKAMRAGKLARIQAGRGSRVIAIIHRQEAMKFFGIPIVRYIDMNDAEQVLLTIRATPNEQPIDVILHTPGGLALAALQIAYALNAHKGKVTVFVPHFAMSGGTLIALAADEIVMSEHAALGPIDPQIDGLPAASIIKVAGEKPLSDIDDRTLMLADLGQKATEQLKRSACELLRHPLSDEAAQGLAEKLTSGRWTHDYPITAREAKELGLPISTDMPMDVLELLTLFPQPVGRQSSVEFGPDTK